MVAMLESQLVVLQAPPNLEGLFSSLVGVEAKVVD
jgi:hypothetical protein